MILSTTTPLSVIQAETANMLPDLLAVGAVGIGVGAGILVLRRGWAFFKSSSR